MCLVDAYLCVALEAPRLQQNDGKKKYNKKIKEKEEASDAACIATLPSLISGPDHYAA